MAAASSSGYEGSGQEDASSEDDGWDDSFIDDSSGSGDQAGVFVVWAHMPISWRMCIGLAQPPGSGGGHVLLHACSAPGTS